mmetsp:Transcript_114958/g.371660  ORF Transcript_114958/g.371660 Transcript_114958/m.371660 type:complete len:344 (-) Transcript_114958:522-1553(-)
MLATSTTPASAPKALDPAEAAPGMGTPSTARPVAPSTGVPRSSASPREAGAVCTRGATAKSSSQRRTYSFSTMSAKSPATVGSAWAAWPSCNWSSRPRIIGSGLLTFSWLTAAPQRLRTSGKSRLDVIQDRAMTLYSNGSVDARTARPATTSCSSCWSPGSLTFAFCAKAGKYNGKAPRASSSMSSHLLNSSHKKAPKGRRMGAPVTSLSSVSCASVADRRYQPTRSEDLSKLPARRLRIAAAIIGITSKSPSPSLSRFATAASAFGVTFVAIRSLGWKVGAAASTRWREPLFRAMASRSKGPSCACQSAECEQVRPPSSGIFRFGPQRGRRARGSRRPLHAR